MFLAKTQRHKDAKKYDYRPEWPSLIENGPFDEGPKLKIDNEMRIIGPNGPVIGTQSEESAKIVCYH